MLCCTETDTYDLETILNTLSQSSFSPVIMQQEPSPPKINVSLDLPGYAGYLPTYWQGQAISGQIELAIDSPILVTHLRVALFGNVQIYGDRPGHPITNGLFEYQRNEQLINCGLRIVKRPSTDLPQYSRVDNNNNDALSTLSADRGELVAGDAIEQQRQQQPKNSQKTPEDRRIERLIRQIATANHTTKSQCNGTLNDLEEMASANCNNNENAFTAFQLDKNTYKVRFSVRVPNSRRLSGSFDHPHYPISYRVVVLLKYKDKEGNQRTCYSTMKVCLESCMDVSLATFSAPITTSPTFQFVQSGGGLVHGLCTRVLSTSSLLSEWMRKVATHRGKIAPSSLASSCLQSHLELPRQAFERSKYIDLQLKLVNHAATHFRISVVKVQIDLVRRINMTCSMNEQVEAITVESATMEFKSSDEEVGALYFERNNLCFSLSRAIKIPEDSACTITAESTRNTFSLNYMLQVKLDISGASHKLSSNTQLEELESVTTASGYWASVPKDFRPTQLRTYSSQLDPIAVIIGNSGF